MTYDDPDGDVKMWNDIDNDEETIVYRPRSYVECNSSDTEFNSDNLSPPELQKSFTSIGKISPKPIRAGFTEIKNNVINFVGSPLGRRRSKTTERQTNDHSFINRTASLDTLGGRKVHLLTRHKQNKSMEESLIKGFTQLSNKTTFTNKFLAEENKFKDGTLVAKIPMGKDRSHSSPACPTCLKNSTACSEVEPSINKSCTSQRHESLGNECVKIASSKSSSFLTVENHDTKEFLPVFTSSSYLYNKDIYETHCISTKVKRPRSFVDLFKQENEQEFLFEKFACSSKSSTVISSNSQIDVSSFEKRSSTFSHGPAKTTTTENHRKINNDADKLDSPRTRAKSMSMLSKENRALEPNNNLKVAHPRINENKTLTRTIHALTSSPKSLKRYFKKKFHIPKEPSEFSTVDGITREEGVRKCVHIESTV